MKAIEDIDDALLLAGIHIGFAERRRALAIELFNEGTSAVDVERLAINITRNTADSAAAGRVLYSVLGNQDQRQRRLADIRKQRELEESRRRDFGAHLRGRPCAVDISDRIRLRMIVYARVVADQHAITDVAADLGISDDLADLLLSEEVERRRKDPAKRTAV